MMNKICGLALITCIATAFAQTYRVGSKELHDLEDQRWARKSGLPASDIRAIRILAGLGDTIGGVIINIDADSLKVRNHILLVEVHNGFCTRVHVLERGAAGFHEIWSLTDVPGRIWGVSESPSAPGRGICGQTGMSANAHGTPDGRIVVEVRVHSDPFQRIIPVDTYSFTWNGSKYELVDGEHR
jgi:hypothetical protein